MGNCSCNMGSGTPLPNIIKVDLNIVKNAEEHHTDKFEMTLSNKELVVRRGQKFSLNLHIDREFNADKYVVVIILKTGEQPKPSNGTMIRLLVASEPIRNVKEILWQAWCEPFLNSKELHINITTAADAIIAHWEMEFHIVRKHDATSRKLPQSIFPVNGFYILFNPWCHDDDVYLKDEEKLNEYVLNDVGKIWRGVKSSYNGMIWNYGQFEPGILEAAMNVLDKSSRLQHSQRSSAIFVSREASAMVNSNDGDGGIVVGNWSGNYEDGKKPTEWQGSIKILNQWMKTNSPVRYGQCWVFSGVLTTVMRALGIPCRPITNFESAHDTDFTITYDVYMDSDGNRLDDMTSDSVWNFHVWNEVWMARPDLPPGYGGWQIIDSTPQERSDSVFQAGPASRTAIRKGEVGFNYDTAFVFAEVNADKVVWLYSGEDEPLEVVHKETDAIGYFISTRRPGSLRRSNEDRRDVTLKYKAPEMSREERLAVMNAVRTGRSPARNIYVSSEVKDVTVEIAIENIPTIGSDFTLNLKLKNVSSEERAVEGVFTIHSMLYTGALHELIKRQLLLINLEPNEDKITEINVNASDYVSRLIDQASMIASAMVKVNETGQMLHTDYNFRVKIPDIHLQVNEPVRVGKPVKVLANFKNPLAIPLTMVNVVIEGPGLEKQYEVEIGTIQSGKEYEVGFEITPKRKGETTLMANLSSKELQDMTGSLTINVEK